MRSNQPEAFRIMNGNIEILGWQLFALVLRQQEGIKACVRSWKLVCSAVTLNQEPHFAQAAQRRAVRTSDKRQRMKRTLL